MASNSVTEIKETKLNHTWTIKNFNLFKFNEIDTKNELESEVFPATLGVKWQWYLKLSYQRIFDGLGQSRSFQSSLVLKRCKDQDLCAVVWFSILNNKGKKTNEQGPIKLKWQTEVKRKMMVADYLTSCSSDFIPHKTLLDRKKELMPNNSLTVFCQIKIIEKPSSLLLLTSEIKNHYENLSTIQLADDFSALLKDEPSCDVTLVCHFDENIPISLMTSNEEIVVPELKDSMLSDWMKVELEDIPEAGKIEFRAHKVILSARSSLFKAMFENNFKEKLENKVDIHDMHPLVLREMLIYIYTDKVPDLCKMPDTLFAVSDLYNLQGLKFLCTKIFESMLLTVDNVLVLYELGDVYTAKSIKIRAVDFVNKYIDEVIDTPKWKELIEKKPGIWQDFWARK